MTRCLVVLLLLVGLLMARSGSAQSGDHASPDGQPDTSDDEAPRAASESASSPAVDDRPLPGWSIPVGALVGAGLGVSVGVSAGAIYWQLEKADECRGLGCLGAGEAIVTGGLVGAGIGAVAGAALMTVLYLGDDRPAQVAYLGDRPAQVAVVPVRGGVLVCVAGRL